MVASLFAIDKRNIWKNVWMEKVFLLFLQA